MGIYPPVGAGLECDETSPPECGVPLDAAIELRFDRFLDPATANRQSLRVYVRFPDLAVFLEPRYDPIERVVAYRPFGGRPWSPDTLYTVEIVEPSAEALDGFRAFDGAALELDADAARFSFRTARASAEPAAPLPPVTCREVVALFEVAGCAAATCHAGATPAAGLLLDSGEGLARTAIRQVAHEAETGVRVGRPLVDPARFGTQMPVIDPGSPAGSYLLYKLLVNPENLAPEMEACTSLYRAPLDEGSCLAPPAAEIERLQAWFVRLDPMPPLGARVRVDDLRRIARFIDRGAPLDECAEAAERDAGR